MVRVQLGERGIGDERVLAAMAAVPREAFVAPELAHRAYEDGALPIGHGQTLSQPWIVAAICEALQLRGDERVLEVGTGSGYSTAVLAQLAASVRSFELVADLATTARERLRRLGVANAEVLAGDGAAGAAACDASFDAIAVHAVAPRPPLGLARALVPGGRMVVPLSEGYSDVLTAFVREDGSDGTSDRREGGNGRGDGDGEGTSVRGEDGLRLRARAIAPCRFVPLLGEAGFPVP